MNRRQRSAPKKFSDRASGLRTGGALVAGTLLVTMLSDPLLAAIDPSEGAVRRPQLQLWSVAQTTAPPPAATQDAIVPPVRREVPQAPAAPDAKPVAPATPAPPPQTTAQPAIKPAAESAAPKTERIPPEFSGVFGTIQEWLARANREYQGVVVKELSLPPTQPSVGADDAIARKLEQQQKEDAAKAAAAKRAEDDARKSAEAKAAAAAKAAEAKKLDEDRKRAEDTKRLADEAKKKADELLKAEQAAQPKPAPPKQDVAQPVPPPAKAVDPAAAQKSREAEQREAQRLADEAKRQEQARQEQQKQEQARQDQVRQEQLKQEQARQDQARRAEAERKAAADRAAAETRRTAQPIQPRQSSRKVVLTPEPIARPVDPGSVFRPEMAGRRATTRVAAATSADDDATPQRATHRRIRAYHEASYRGLGGPAARAPQVKRWVWRAGGHHCAGAGRQITPPARYTIKRGDSLWRISERHYDEGRLYPKIYRANRAKIADPDLIYPCQRVMVPRKR